MVERSHRFNMMFSEDEERMLRWLAEEYGLSASDVVRTLIRNEYTRRSYENRAIKRGAMAPRPVMITSGGPTIVPGYDLVARGSKAKRTKKGDK